jgi:hypothetical protein
VYHELNRPPLVLPMRLPLIIAAVVCSLLFTQPAEAASPKRKKTLSSRQAGVVIRVEGPGWSRTQREEIEAVLYAVADELITQVPQKLANPIVVTYGESNPMVLYERGPRGEYLVHLSAKDGRWPQFAYQFAHELCHILSNYEDHTSAGSIKHNQWFEEALCETASLFTLRRMAATLEASASDPKRKVTAAALRSYAQELIDEGHRQLPASTSLTRWLAQNEEKLRKDPYLRDKNEVIANLLLPLFEQDPENWDAVRYLNLDPADARNSLKQYLHNWYANAPQTHRQFIAHVLGLLHVDSGEALALTRAKLDELPSPLAAPSAASAQAGPAGRDEDRSP